MKKKTASEFVRYNKKEGTHSGFKKGMIPPTISPLLYSHAKHMTHSCCKDLVDRIAGADLLMKLQSM
jgi:hypothetical protein